MLIAHLSDLHLSDKFKPENFEKTEIIIERALELEVDHFVVTGDISDNADERDYRKFRNLLKKYDLLESGKTSIVIGNHDIFGGVQTALDVVNFPSRCHLTDFDEKVKHFVDSFHELFENAYFPLKGKFFPYAKQIADHVFVGLNSIDRYSKLKNPLASNGKIGREQRAALKSIFEDNRFKFLRKIILVHHHFYKRGVEATASQNSMWNKIESFTLNLRGKKKLMNLFSELGIELILHGHSHEVKEYERKGLRFLNAGAVIDNSLAEEARLLIVKTADEMIYTWTENIVVNNSILAVETESIQIAADYIG